MITESELSALRAETSEAEAGRLREALTAQKRYCYHHNNGDDSCHCKEIDTALAASPASETKQGEREAVAEACIKWVAEWWADEDGFCQHCFKSGDHALNCLHLRAKALRAQAPAGGEGEA